MAASNRTAAASDLQGAVFGRWTVVGPSEKRGRLHWPCRCSCGTERLIRHSVLIAGASNSCGCFRRDSARKHNTTHGLTGSPEWTVWQQMRARCENINHKAYSRYGGRGITVCKRWMESFENFLEDMGARPSPSHSIDRINNDAGYSRGNCRWATRLEQANNRRSNRILTHNGLTMTVSQWAARKGCHRNLILLRLLHGWSVSDALTR